MPRNISQWKKSARKVERRMNTIFRGRSTSKAQRLAVKRWGAVETALTKAKVRNSARSMSRNQAEKNLAVLQKRIDEWTSLPIDKSPNNYDEVLKRLWEKQSFASLVLDEITGEAEKLSKLRKRVRDEKNK